MMFNNFLDYRKTESGAVPFSKGNKRLEQRIADIIRYTFSGIADSKFNSDPFIIFICQMKRSDRN